MLPLAHAPPRRRWKGFEAPVRLSEAVPNRTFGTPHAAAVVYRDHAFRHLHLVSVEPANTKPATGRWLSCSQEGELNCSFRGKRPSPPVSFSSSHPPKECLGY